MEIWKSVVGYEGLYEVSNLGRIMSMNYKHTKRKKIMKQANTHGYYRLNISNNGSFKQYMAHRIIAEAFIPNIDNKSEINHKDGNKLNNNINNLEWCTQSENMKHAYNNMLKVPYALGKFGKDNKTSKPIIQSKKNGEFVKLWFSGMDIQRELGFNHSSISSCCRGHSKTSHGYIWKY